MTQKMTDLAEKAFASGGRILIDQDLRGWKELDTEVVLRRRQ
jgi:hypothetical protein